MTDGPTTMNGPLHSDEAGLGDRAMTASFATPEAAKAARQALLDAGVAAGQIEIVAHAAGDGDVQASGAPAEPGLLGRIREAVLPDDGERATRVAARNDDAILVLRPRAEQVETAVRVLQAAKPTRFDADLERWRNA